MVTADEMARSPMTPLAPMANAVGLRQRLFLYYQKGVARRAGIKRSGHIGMPSGRGSSPGPPRGRNLRSLWTVTSARTTRKCSSRSVACKSGLALPVFQYRAAVSGRVISDAMYRNWVQPVECPPIGTTLGGDTASLGTAAPLAHRPSATSRRFLKYSKIRYTLMPYILHDSPRRPPEPACQWPTMVIDYQTSATGYSTICSTCGANLVMPSPRYNGAVQNVWLPPARPGTNFWSTKTWFEHTQGLRLQDGENHHVRQGG